MEGITTSVIETTRKPLETEKTDLIMEGITTLVLLPMSKPISRREN